ncbi:plastidal glycolate glycerate translocator 1, chloroplastic [Olea europaea subsp. europaea]|uniref:Plastidal glycolate glycerate translocator 1, chloroplastic n=1 Tax=Olea europaea subsp. europaea TaxID=158383 RepID=A0A8S0S5T6_OLEEU|nr:plastidal glycolate glycerate translocator 1, chloroplastic [Olea europaea subsp. europaea]
MATASAISRNVPFIPAIYNSSRISCLNHLNFAKNLRKIRSISLAVASDGESRTHNEYSNSHKNSRPNNVHGLHSKFLSADLQKSHSNRTVIVKSMESTSGSTSTGILSMVFKVMHLIVSLGIILAMDKYLKKAFIAAAIKFPSALFGMFCVFTVLNVLDFVVPAAATGLMNFFEPAFLFIQRWLPLFYVPSLVVLPLAVKDIPAASGLKIVFIIVAGWLASLSVAGFTAIAVRKMVKTEMIPAEPMSKPSPFSSFELWTWSAIFLISFVSALLYPTVLGTNARTCLPFLLSSTVLGYIIGSGLPSDVKKIFHPIICCALSADVAALAYGQLSQLGINSVLGYYLTKAPSNPGAGDILMGFLGSVIISFAFSMFKQRKLVKRHAAEMLTSVILSTVFSLYSTALIGRLIGLEPDLTISVLPRCITVALALSIVSFFEGANSSLTAAVVVLTGLVGANFVQTTLDKFGFQDPIARGIATASSAHGLGTAALSAKEPEALPFCAIAYALTGIFGSLICSVPAVRQSLLAIVG